MSVAGILYKSVLQCRRCLRNPSSLLTLQKTRQYDLRHLHTSPLLNMSKTVPYILSDIGEGIVEVIVKEWFVKEGDTVAQFDPVCEVQSDKASVTITCRFDGKVGALHYTVDDIAKVGSPLLDVIVSDDDSPSDSTKSIVQSAEESRPIATTVTENDEHFINKALATPAVRRIAKENSVDLKNVSSTGKGGRVLKEDILAYLATSGKANQGPVANAPSAIFTNAEKMIIKVGEDYSENITGIKKAMVKSMTQAWKIPHFTYSDEVDVSAIVELRKQSRRLEAETGVKVTALAFLLKAASLSLLKFPKLNAVVDDDCQQLSVKGSHNLGVAMDSPAGLIVPNIKNVEQLGVGDIARELRRLQNSALASKVPLSDLQGGTLTLSNIGAIGGTVATPILLPPQVVIGAFGKNQRLPRFDADGSIKAVDIMNVSWSADHRVVDGATVARFSNLFKLYLSSPELLLKL